MRLVFPKAMTKRQASALKLCLSVPPPPFSIEDVVSALSSQIGRLFAGAKVIDRAFPVPGLGRIDLLCLGTKSNPILVCACGSLCPSELCRGFMLADWISEHRELIDHVFPGASPSGRAEVCHVAGEIDPAAVALLRRIGREDVRVFTFRPLLLDGERWLVTERFEAEEGNVPRRPAAHEATGGEGSCRDSVVHLPIKSVLTEGEIDGIMRGCTPDDDEVTSRTQNFR